MKNSVSHFHVSAQPNQIRWTCLLCKHRRQVDLSLPVLIFLKLQNVLPIKLCFPSARHLLQMYPSLSVSCYLFRFVLPFTPCCSVAALKVRCWQALWSYHVMALPYCQLRRVVCQYVQLLAAVGKLESCQFEPGLLLSVRTGGVMKAEHFWSAYRTVKVWSEGCSGGDVYPTRTIVRTCSGALSLSVRETV